MEVRPAAPTNSTTSHYNYYRDYDPNIGRYVESDPIGISLETNTFGYAASAPLSNSDSLGLWSVTFGAYAGVGAPGPGGQITFGKDNGHGFMSIRLGFGWGAGWNYTPDGGAPGGPLPQEVVRGALFRAL